MTTNGYGWTSKLQSILAGIVLLIGGTFWLAQFAQAEEARLPEISTETITGKANKETVTASTTSEKITPEMGRHMREAEEKWRRGIDRHIGVTPKTPKKGINTGLVIVFGHVLKPPFELKYGHNRFSINGVVIYPSPISQREHDKHQHETTKQEMAEVLEVEDFTNQAQAAYRKKKGTVSEEVLEKELLDFVKAQRLVIDAYWSDSELILIKLRNNKFNSFGYGITFSTQEPMPQSQAERDDLAKQDQAYYLNRMERYLRKGIGIFCLSDGNCASLHDDIRPQVNEIMSDPTLSQEQRTQMLRSKVFDGSLDAALDIMTNYDPKEWGVKK